MDRKNIVDFNERLTQARDILESAHRAEALMMEENLRDTDEIISQLRIRHSELLTFVKEVALEWERTTTEMMSYILDRETKRIEDYRARLTQLRELPAKTIEGKK